MTFETLPAGPMNSAKTPVKFLFSDEVCVRPSQEASGEKGSKDYWMAAFTTFPPAPGLHCEHCPELAEHWLSSSESGDLNLCPKCLRDALDVISSLKAFKGVLS